MPRAPSEKMLEAEKLFNGGMAMVDIAKKLGVSAGTVRSWKNRHGWGGKSKKTKCNVAKKDNKKTATLQKRKRGGQKGNTNAKGGSGNPRPKNTTPPDRTKHGGYRPVFMDALDEDEQELVEHVPEDEEKLLIEEIQLLSVRERRILQAINKYRQQNGDVAVAYVTRFEEKRTFKDKEEEADYDKRIAAKVASGVRLPGKSFSIQTHTSNKDMVIARLEQELSTVQKAKTKAVETLSKIRIEKKKMDSNVNGSGAVDDWIAAVLGEDGADEQE